MQLEKLSHKKQMEVSRTLQMACSRLYKRAGIKVSLELVPLDTTVTAADIRREVLKEFGITWEDIITGPNKELFLIGRYCYVYFMHTYCPWVETSELVTELQKNRISIYYADTIIRNILQTNNLKWAERVRRIAANLQSLIA